MKFYFLRSASHNFEIADEGYRDKGLSPEASLELERILPQIKENGIKRLLTSTSPRSQETAQLLVDKGVFSEFIILKEFGPLHLPSAENWRTFQGLKKRTKKPWAELWVNIIIPGFEGPASFLRRIEHALFINQEYFDETALLVAYEETLWALRALTESKEWLEIVKEIVLPAAFYPIELSFVQRK